MNVDAINAACFRAFAEPVTVTVDGVSTPLRGIFDSARADVLVQMASSYRYTLAVKTNDIAGLNVQKNKNHTVTYNGTDYLIVDSIAQAGGLTRWYLRQHG
ncbi:MAG: hypothetical protein PHU14_09910 [Methylovulum sp.]|nr:hypothetical protein [Methylovulum sp.]